MKLSKAISSPAGSNIYRLFPHGGIKPYDPGLWRIILDQLPEEYSIPDPQFTKKIKQHNQELAQISP